MQLLLSYSIWLSCFNLFVFCYCNLLFDNRLSNLFSLHFDKRSLIFIIIEYFLFVLLYGLLILQFVKLTFFSMILFCGKVVSIPSLLHMISSFFRLDYFFKKLSSAQCIFNPLLSFCLFLLKFIYTSLHLIKTLMHYFYIIFGTQHVMCIVHISTPFGTHTYSINFVRSNRDRKFILLTFISGVS